MNAIYKVIWNDAIRQYQVVNELCRSRRKACSVKAVHTDGFGRTIERRVLATAAATLIGSAALLGAPGSVWAGDFNLGEHAPDIEINIGTGSVNNGTPPKVDFSLLPGSNETIYINQSAFTGFASNIFNQEERTPPLYLLETTDSGAMVSDINLSILGADGQPLDLTNNPLGTTGTANFYYTFDNTRIVDGFLYVYRTLNRIDLTSQDGYGQVFDVSDSKGADLKAAITGAGNITFSYNSTGEGGDPGHLTLSNPDGVNNANTYTGKTFVGYNSQGAESSPVNIYFGKDGALGSTIGTEQLQIAAQSAVHFGGENDNEAYTQTVRGLSGSGLLHLGTQATLTLNQSSSDTGLVPVVPDGAGQIIISNRYAGSGTYNAANGSYSGSVFNVNLSDKVAGYELVFTDTASDYTGLINLTNAAVTAYDTEQTVNVGGIDYTPNALLESATLQLQSGSHLKVTDKGSVHNLIIAHENTSIVFDNLDLGTGILEIDNLSLQNTGKVEIDNIGSGLQGAADDLGYLEADGGITQEIIRVSGTIVGDENDMVLAGDALQEKQTELSTDDVEADLYWNFDPNLIFNAEDKTYSAKYGLTKVNVESGQFALEASEGATGATADFTAQITGSGGLLIDASGTQVTLGNTADGAPANSYSGATTVTSGTDVILAVDKAMGNTSSLDADGNVTLAKEVDQTIKGLTGSGTLTLEDDSVLTLMQSGDAILDNVLSGNGTFRVSGTGTDKTNVVFNKEFGYDGAFDFSNTVFDLDEGHNRDAAASADFNLSNSVLHLGESGGTFGNMVVNDGVQFDSAYLVIGSDTAALSGTGSLTFNSNTSIKLEGISVADDIALIDFDENTQYQDFITASGGITGPGNVTLQGQNLASFTGSYTQNGTKVANTTWVVSSDLQKNGSDSLQAGALLTGIELTGGELVISGAGTLAALVTQADDAQNAAIRFSLADGALSSSMTVSNTNDFTAAVSVDGGVKLSLAANNALGKTSGLTVAGTAEVALNDGVSQTVGGLEGTGTVSLGSGSAFTLSQNGAASLETAVAGDANSTFTVNLGNSNNVLTFENRTGYNGKFVLQNAHLQFADNSNAEAVLGGSNFVLDDGAVFDLQSGTAGTLSGLVFDGGTLGTHQTTLADAGNAQLNVSGDVSLDESSKIEAGGITLTGASDVLRADNAKGVRQVFIQYTGEFNSGNGAQLSIDGDALASSDIFNEGDPDTAVAHGTWSGSVGVDEAGKKIYGNLQLTQIDLIGSGDGLILNAAEASDSTLSALVTGSGNLTLAGDLTISGSAPNKYTGETAVTSGTVKLGMDSGFGNTSKLEIWSNAAVDFGAHSQTVGSLEIGNTQLGATDALRGTGTLTLASGGTSEIWGSNNYSGTIVLGSGHDLAINNASGIGASAKVGFSATDSVLTIKGAESGTFETELSGAGTVVVSDSNIAVSGGNTSFKGKWELQSGAGVTVSDNVDAVLGTGAGIALDGTLTLDFASSSATDVTIDEKLSGSGSLVLTGANNQRFGLAGSGSDFNGTVALNQIGMTVGGSGTGANNSEAFKDADLVLQSGSVLEVATGSTVTTFDKVSVNNGQTAGFKFGGLGFNSDGTTASGTSALVINELVNNGSAEIALDALGTNSDLLGEAKESTLINGGVDVFQALIQTGIVMDESILENFKLTGVGNGKATQEIKSTTEQVATGYYDFDLALGDSGTDLGVSYDLTRIDISGGKTLTLYEEGTLDAQLTSDGGAGALTIAAGGDITLANASESALNSYTGVTNVLGKLTAYADNLGSTSKLQIGTSGQYVNAGDNKVGLLDANGKLELWKGHTLEITQDASGRSSIAGTLTGGGDLLFAAGDLIVIGTTTPSDYDGTVYVGSANSDAILTISGAGALGTGSIVLGTNSGSRVNVYGTGDQTFSNKISGFGTINVNLSGGAFAFGTDQANLATGSRLNFLGATFSLDDTSNAAVAGKTLIGLSGDSLLVSSGDSDKNVWGLDLTSGGTIDFGQIDGSGGQLVLSSNDGTWSGSGRIDLSSNNQTTVVFEDGTSQQTGNRFDEANNGSALLSGGGVFDLTLFEGVSDVYLDGSQITASGTSSISGFQTDSSFSGTGENYYQDADGDGTADDLVAKLYRGGNGSFYYDADEDVIYMRYGIRQIDLQDSDSGRGLRLAADGNGGELSADVTGSGNIVYAGGNIRVNGSNNNYTGSTYVENGANVELGKNNALGKTDYLSIVAGSTVTLGNGLSQTVGELVGDGTLNLVNDSTFTINNSQRQNGENDPAAKDDILINTDVVAFSGAKFVINGAGAADGRADVSFAKDASLEGADFTLENAEIRFDHANATDLSYGSVNDAANFTLGTNSELVVDARNGTAAQNYSIDNTLTLSGGLISFSDVQLTTEAGNTAILDVGHIEVTDSGFIGVSATIDDNFNILDADTQNFQQTLISYDSITGRDKLQAATSDQIDDSAIKNDSGNTVAYVEWDGGFVAEDQSPENTIVMSYKVAKLKLAQGGEENGLVLDANDHDTKLSVLIDDADEVKNNGGGNITFAGGDITVTHENTYTGVTKVTAGSVTLDANSAFGSSRLLAVENGTVNFSTVSQTLGSIDVGVSGNITGISGTGMVTLGSDAYADGISTISGQHSDFDTNLTLANGHTLTLNDTFGIGDTGTVVLGGDTKLVINDIDGGDLTKIVSGEAGANVRLSGSGFEISADNKNYRGNWTFTDGTTVSVAGDDNLSADDRLGSSGMVTLGNNASLALSQVKDNITIDNVFAGAGNLVVSGTNGQTFEFSRKWSHAEASGFTGTLRLNGDIQMTVGGKGDSSGANNAANLAYADFHLGADSKLIVEKQMSVVDTFDNLNVAQGSTVEFKGQLRTGAAPSNLGRLQVHTLTGTGNILLDIPTTDDTVVQEVAENYLLDLDTPQFETLITVESGAVSADGWTLNGESEDGSGFRQAVTNGTDTVAHAIYDYGLGVRNTDDDADADSLGVELDLTQVDIVKDQTLTFSTNGTLSAQVTNSSGAGNLSVTSGAEVTLSGKNNYSGNTNVVDKGSKLTAGESGLGNTNTLDLASGTAFVNAGLNTVKSLTASDATIELNKTFTLASGVADRSTITGGSISGVGTLAIKNGWLTVSGELNDEKFSGIVDLGNVNPTVGYGGATLVLDGLAGIGHGTINFTTATSALDVNGSVGTTLTNLVSGAGEINVDLGVSTNVFDFRSDQGDAFKGWLILNNAGYHLYDDAGELASATLLTSGGGYVTVNTANYIADHKVGGLSLYGGTLDFGLLTEGSESGQIEVGADGFATNASPTVVKVALGENNNATGSDVFDLNSDLSVLLIEGFDATGRDLTSLDFSGSDEVDQLVKQSGRYADGSATAELTYSSGHLVGNESGISAAWDLSQINLLSGNGEGFLINASGESGGAGTISALITGDGNIEFAGGTVTLNNSQNSYSGSTTVSNETTLDLAQTGALGNTSDLKIESGTVAFNGTEQTIGSIHVDQTGEFTMSGSGSLTLTSGASVIASANEGAFGGELIVQNDATLELRGSNAAGNLELAAVAQTSSISFTRVGSDTGYAEVDNLLTGSGTYIIGDGTNAAYVEFTNTANNFASVDVLKEGHFLINGMEDNSNNALGAAGLSLAGGAYAELNGSSGWTFDNVLDIDEGGELALSAGGSGNAFNFAGTNQRIDGTVTLTDLMLTIGGASGSGNAAVLDSASVVAGSNSHVHVALGNVADDRQQVKDFTLSSGAEITFDGQLGMSGVGANVLGQMDVSGTLTLDSGSTVHVSVDPNTGASSTVAQDRLVETAASGSFQNLITAGTIDGSAVSDNGTVIGIGLTDSRGTRSKPSVRTSRTATTPLRSARSGLVCLFPAAASACATVCRRSTSSAI